MKPADARKLKRDELMDLRRRGVQAVQNGEPPLVVARVLGVGISTVFGWLARYRRGDITELADPVTAAVVAHYECSPFGSRPRPSGGDSRPDHRERSERPVGSGNLLVSSGPLAATNPYRFSSKEHDATGLVYYGYRYYSPELGRWINRDPMEEQGGVGLYVFADNAGVLFYDALGLYPVVWTPVFSINVRLKSLRVPRRCGAEGRAELEVKTVLNAWFVEKTITTTIDIRSNPNGHPEDACSTSCGPASRTGPSVDPSLAPPEVTVAMSYGSNCLKLEWTGTFGVDPLELRRLLRLRGGRGSLLGQAIKIENSLLLKGAREDYLDACCMCYETAFTASSTARTRFYPTRALFAYGVVRVLSGAPAMASSIPGKLRTVWQRIAEIFPPLPGGSPVTP